MTATTTTPTTVYDAAHDIAQAFAPQPKRVQRKAATPAGVLALLELILSPSYTHKDSRIEVSADANYFEAFNKKWIASVDSRWSGGICYKRHAVTSAGREVLAALRDELTIPYDEFSAEWLRYLEADAARSAAKVAERRYVENVLYQEHVSDVQAQREQVML